MYISIDSAIHKVNGHQKYFKSLLKMLLYFVFSISTVI